ncbi:biotin carboxylase N-terminal domain-containing protein [Winogradskya consettensis]|uniref:Acetyl-/propionyl-CoA carboxylase alpha subunit AccA2 n=1 Tax=Winogradskya consettensis TaxID=113560 RepID=A0A919W2D1_9ACTN|nr:biotin carboxylase N-terminal domain-containing protein [Actinoplanes consettensis]GIM85256.1 putative acetyl-/propionyl-CoA carboxylase alpha subunit AccA2 [Actinoplanes consettensis]
MITSVLVANRGEIARRIFTTCHRRGLATVAVFSDPDAGSPHVHEADSAVRLPGSTPADTYLRGDLIIEAARRAGADAIHPGYGFLAENAAFASAVQAAGLTWIGPSADAISLMGSKIESKSLMAAAGVPVLERLDPATITEADLPVMVKASAGGGGRGIRIVFSLSDLSSAIDEASREASSAFGDPTVFCERYIATGHHIEVQIMADAHGTVWALGERECSLQRRHQKVIEEAPAPLVDRVGGDLRKRLHAAGRDAAAAVGYVGAGTVEFLADDDGEFWFLEMNTRLQVEHPVTECVTGTDLVALQLDMAEGAPLTGPEPAMTGHAVEARLYAESPVDDWRPQTGTVHLFDIPAVEGIRLDSGVEAGTVIGTHYDAMLAKVISHAPSRVAAIRQLAATLRRSRIHGVTTNRDLLVGSLLHPTFLDGTASTSFYADHPPASLVISPGLDLQLAALIAALSDAAHERGPLLPGVAGGFRNIPVGYRTRGYAIGDVSLLTAYRLARGILDVPDLSGISLVSASPARVVLDVDGVRRAFRIGRFDDTVVIDSPAGSLSLRRLPRFTDPSTQLPPGALTAPMPGTVVRIDVAVGETVTAGQPLVRLEAMKMEHAVHAPAAGTVTELPVRVGQQVSQGTPLAVVSHDVPT